MPLRLFAPGIVRRVVSWLAVVLVAWSLWALTLFLSQRRMLFPGREAPAIPEDGSLPGAPLARLHALELPDGSVVESWWLPAAPTVPRPAPALIFTHGNYDLVDEWAGSFGRVRAAGAGVLLLEFPGYGRSTGVATETSLTAAAVAAWDLLAAMSQEVDAQRIVALGRSVGGGAACALSLRRPLAALALSSAFTSTRAYARRYLVPGFLVRHPFDNEAAVSAFPGPVLVQHGRRDTTVPFAYGERLVAAAADGELLSYDCAHNDCPWGRTLDDLVTFLSDRGILAPDGNPPGRGGVG